MAAHERAGARDEARSALMREALEEDWRRCPDEHWPIVRQALREDAGQRSLGRIRRLEAERDALAG